MANVDKIPKKFREYIFVKHNFFYVKKIYENTTKTFGKFDSLRKACAATSILLKNNWKIRDVSTNPLVTYDNEFWVFNVVDDKLFFETKFTDFEEAVEYVEINLRCNDYHNDIFKGSSKKKGYKNRFKLQNEEIKTSDEYIFEKSGKFIVKRSKRINSKCYGEFDNFDEALAAKKLLLDCGWRVKEGKEILFYNNQYWIFESVDGIISFKGKTKSYEDALDLISISNTQNDENGFTNPFIKSVEDNFDRVMEKRKLESQKHQKSIKDSDFKLYNKDEIDRNLNYYNIVKKNLNVKKHVDIRRIWIPKNNHIAPKKDHLRIFVERCESNVDNLFSIIDFNFFSEKVIQCIVDGTEIEWRRRNDINISYFLEFPLIVNILEINGWDLSKLSNSSSIYFYNNAYYKIQVFENTIILGKFISYEDAENTVFTYKNSPLMPGDNTYLGIDKVGGKYEFIKFKKGEVYKTFRLKSLEEIKAIRDILINSNWDFSIFDKYTLFYWNGFYWELTCRNNVIYLKNKYELIKTR